MSGPSTSGGAGSAGSIAQGAIASSVYNDNSSQTTDASEHLGLQTGTQSVGDAISLQGSTVQSLNLTDPGAIQAGQTIALAAIQGNAQASQALAADAQYAIGKASDLATTAAQGQGGELIKAVEVVAALATLAGVVWAFAGRNKKDKPNASA
jgi:hypothetical protein